MRKFTFSALCFAAVFSMNAQTETTMYSDDFKDLIPYTAIEAQGNNSVYDGIGTNDASGGCINITKAVVDGKSAYEEMLEKGYTFLCTKPGGGTPSTPQTTFYLQKTVENEQTTGAYLRIGQKGYTSGLMLPALKDLPDDGVSNVKVSFQWCPVRGGKTAYDYTHLSVTVTPYDAATDSYGAEITKEGEGRENVEETNYGKTEDLSFPSGSEMAWHDAVLDFGDYVMKNGDRISIRCGANQWPMNAKYDGIKSDLTPSDGLCRYFIRDIKVTAPELISTSVVESLMDENAPVEYFNLQGMRVVEPENGIYIVKQGNKISKKVIK